MPPAADGDAAGSSHSDWSDDDSGGDWGAAPRPPAPSSPPAVHAVLTAEAVAQARARAASSQGLDPNDAAGASALVHEGAAKETDRRRRRRRRQRRRARRAAAASEGRGGGVVVGGKSAAASQGGSVFAAALGPCLAGRFAAPLPPPSREGGSPPTPSSPLPLGQWLRGWASSALGLNPPSEGGGSGSSGGSGGGSGGSSGDSSSRSSSSSSSSSSSDESGGSGAEGGGYLHLQRRSGLVARMPPGALAAVVADFSGLQVELAGGRGRRGRRGGLS